MLPFMSDLSAFFLYDLAFQMLFSGFWVWVVCEIARD
jgi:hypothetical protein